MRGIPTNYSTDVSIVSLTLEDPSIGIAMAVLIFPRQNSKQFRYYIALPCEKRNKTGTHANNSQLTSQSYLILGCVKQSLPLKIPTKCPCKLLSCLVSQKRHYVTFPSSDTPTASRRFPGEFLAAQLAGVHDPSLMSMCSGVRLDFMKAENLLQSSLILLIYLE